MGRMNFDGMTAGCLDPASCDTAARKDNGIDFPIRLDDGHLDVAVKRGGFDLHPRHRSKIIGDSGTEFDRYQSLGVIFAAAFGYWPAKRRVWLLPRPTASAASQPFLDRFPWPASPYNGRCLPAARNPARPDIPFLTAPSRFHYAPAGK